MSNSFFCLRHDSIISTYHENHYVRNVCTSCAHSCEGLVSGSVEKDYGLIVLHDYVRAYMLSDASCFVCCYGRVPDVVEEGSFAVIDMTHYCDDRRTLDEFRLRLWRLRLFWSLRLRLRFAVMFRAFLSCWLSLVLS